METNREPIANQLDTNRKRKENTGFAGESTKNARKTQHVRRNSEEPMETNREPIGNQLDTNRKRKENTGFVGEPIENAWKTGRGKGREAKE